MATLVQIYAASSVDGYLAPPDGSVGWLEGFDDGPDLGFGDFYGQVGAIVGGRTTFDQVRGFGEWPYEGKPVVVLSSQDAPSAIPDGVTFDRGDDLPALIEQLRHRADGKNIWVFGGGKTHRAFLNAYLVDEIWTHVLPVMLGDGISIFPPGSPAHPVKLIESRTYGNGVVMLRYSTRISVQ